MRQKYSYKRKYSRGHGLFKVFITGVAVLMGGIATWLGMLLFPIVAFIEYFLKDDFSVREMSDAGAVFMLYLQLIP
ncbi:MAG TPA: hypothetical protein EYG50_01525 [Cycloclasticus sp.]|jgi:hypothetical protein|nr:hypothetical protein [Cycloclasticus sp.]